MKQDFYRMKMLNIERLPDVANAKTIKQMIETDKYQWRESGMTKKEVKERIVKKLYCSWVATGEYPYYRAYCLLDRFYRGR